MTVQGECGGGQPIGLWSGEGEAGKGSCVPFHSEGTHTTITAQQTSNWVLTTEAGTTTCTKASFTATAEASSFEAITATPTLSGCITKTIFGSLSVTAMFNGCDWRLGTSSYQLQCPEGKSLTIIGPESGPFCTITVPAQTFASGVTYTDTGSGSSRDMDLALNLSAISYSATGSFCSKPGSFTNGKLTNGMTVQGENTAAAQVGIWTE